MNVTACLVTRGDVPMQPILDSLPPEWEIILWDNESWINGESPECHRILPHHRDEIDETWLVKDLAVYGRYAAIKYASHDFIYTQDDDCIVSDPWAVVDALESIPTVYRTAHRHDLVACNMPYSFRDGPEEDRVMVGFGAAFHRDLPRRAFGTFLGEEPQMARSDNRDVFYRQCDLVFTTLTPTLLTHVPLQLLDYSFAENRMWREAGRQLERRQILERLKEIS